MNKFNKAKTIGLISASLAGVSLMGVGFATWVISGENYATSNGVSVTVADVIDNRISITDVSVTDADVNFDAKYADTEGALLKAKDGKEDLSFSIKYTIKNATDTNKFNVFAYIASGNQPTFTTAVTTKKLIGMPDALNLTETGTPVNSVSFNGTDLTLATGVAREANQTGNGTITVTQTFTFKWGLAFASKNPSEVLANDKIHDSNKDANASPVGANVDILKTNIEALRTLQKDLNNFTVVLQPKIVA